MFNHLDGTNNVGVSVDEAHEFFKAPKAAFTNTKNTPK